MDAVFLVISCIRARKGKSAWGFWIAALALDLLAVVMYTTEAGATMIAVGAIVIAALYVPTGLYIHRCLKNPPAETAQRVCPKCGAVQNAEWQFCHACGADMGVQTAQTAQPAQPVQEVKAEPVVRPLRDDEIACPKCGARQAAARSTCYACGTQLH